MTDEAWIDTVRLARDLGTVSQLLPEWCRNIQDAPWVLFDAIRTALMFCKFEELPEKEVPPKRIWLDGDKLNDWFRMVKRRREEEMRGDGGSSDSSYEDGGMETNPAAAQLMVG